MAVISITSSLDMHNVNTWYGYVGSYDAGHITIVNGSLQGTYFGAFSYDSAGNVYGTLTGVTESYSGTPIFAASGLNVSASYVEQWVETNQIQAFLQAALAGNDQFTVSAGTHVIDGYGGYNTLTEPLSFGSYAITRSGSAVTINSSVSSDTLFNIQSVNFSNGSYNTSTGTFTPTNATPTPVGSGFTATDTTTGQSASGAAQAYTGPVSGLQTQYIAITPDSLNVGVTTDNWFIHTGSGNDAVAVHGGTNVLDGGTGSNFLTGGSGSDTFFVDDRGPSADIWSTVNNFHAGDAATIWGVSPGGFTLSWADNQGATGYTGLTLHATAAGKPTASLTLAGYTQSDLSNGRLSVSYGTDAASGSTYMYIHGNG